MSEKKQNARGRGKWGALKVPWSARGTGRGREFLRRSKGGNDAAGVDRGEGFM